MPTSRLLRPLCLAICLFAMSIGRATYAAAAPATKDEDAVKALVLAFDKAMNAKDAVALSATFHEDGEFTNVVGMTARGRGTIERFHRPLFEGDGTKGVPSFKDAVFKTVDTRIRFIRPDVASVDVTWTQTGSTLDGKDRGPRRGLMSWIATREDGKWGVAVMHNMDLLPVERPKAP
jgi:uncharacterized protein (TIGR02246 family)